MAVTTGTSQQWHITMNITSQSSAEQIGFGAIWRRFVFFSCILKFCLVSDAGMFPKPSWRQGSSTAAQRHSRQPGSEDLPREVSKGHRNQEQCSHDSDGHSLDPQKPWANNSITHIYLQVIPDLSVPGRAAGPSMVHSCDAQQCSQWCLLHCALYFNRTQQPPGRHTWMHNTRNKGKTTSTPPICITTGRMPTEQYNTSASA